MAGGPGCGLASSVVKPLTEPEIRAAFVNCSKGEAKRASIPRNLSGQPWENLDFLGWRDPQSPERAYLAAEIDGRLVAITLRCPGPSPLQKKTSMCSFCLTSHSGGVTLMVAPRTGQAASRATRWASICAPTLLALCTCGGRSRSGDLAAVPPGSSPWRSRPSG